MTQALLSLEAVTRKVEAGARLLLAGEESLLRCLPRGSWIAGTIPYFMDVSGGRFDEEQLFAAELPQSCATATVVVYDKERLTRVYAEGPARGFSFVIIPGMSPTHLAFAVDAPGYADFAKRPLVGWVAGVNLERLGQVTPKVIDGATLTVHEDAAVVMHVELAAGKVADVEILNIFEPGSGDAIRFPETGFAARKAMVNGAEVVFGDYLEQQGLDTRMPLVADYAGARVNTSFQKVDRAEGVVHFYAPVFAGMEYRLARRVDDYVAAFRAKLPKVQAGDVVFSCNCILNYLYSKLKGKKTGDFVGPFTFGEIAYQLVNQTLAYLVVMDA
jgi:hypothetical protein